MSQPFAVACAHSDEVKCDACGTSGDTKSFITKCYKEVELPDPEQEMPKYCENLGKEGHDRIPDSDLLGINLLGIDVTQYEDMKALVRDYKIEAYARGPPPQQGDK